MKRKLGIAWSAACGLLCLLLAALWVRSHYYDCHLTRSGGGDFMAFGAQGGQIVVVKLADPAAGPPTWSAYFDPGRGLEKSKIRTSVSRAPVLRFNQQMRTLGCGREESPKAVAVFLPSP
jgi:hypothetical protein